MHPSRSRPVLVEHKGERRPLRVKPKKWSHQDELEALRGKRIVIVYRDGLGAKGTLLNADQFVLQIELDGHPRSVFKHDLSSYGAVVEAE